MILLGVNHPTSQAVGHSKRRPSGPEFKQLHQWQPSCSPCSRLCSSCSSLSSASSSTSTSSGSPNGRRRRAVFTGWAAGAPSPELWLAAAAVRRSLLRFPAGRPGVTCAPPPRHKRRGVAERAGAPALRAAPPVATFRTAPAAGIDRTAGRRMNKPCRAEAGGWRSPMLAAWRPPLKPCLPCQHEPTNFIIRCCSCLVRDHTPPSCSHRSIELYQPDSSPHVTAVPRRTPVTTLEPALTPGLHSCKRLHSGLLPCHTAAGIKASYCRSGRRHGGSYSSGAELKGERQQIRGAAGRRAAPGRRRRPARRASFCRRTPPGGRSWDKCCTWQGWFRVGAGTARRRAARRAARLGARFTSPWGWRRCKRWRRRS